MKHNSEMFCFNFLSSGKMHSEDTRSECKLEDEGNIHRKTKVPWTTFCILGARIARRRD